MAEKDWTTGLFKCNESLVMFAWACCVPCGSVCMQAINAKLVHLEASNGALVACLCAGFFCCIGAGYNRYLLSGKLAIKGNLCLDMVLECFIGCCAVSQEWREVMKLTNKPITTPIWAALKK
jgi:Cys-rich protein (TIGR01571 family)